MEWTKDAIRLFFFPRGAIPYDIDILQPTPANWGTPMAAMTSSQCDLGSHFVDHMMVTNIALCGDWAGSVWNLANSGFSEERSAAAITGFSDCNSFMATNPVILKDAVSAFR